MITKYNREPFMQTKKDADSTSSEEFCFLVKAFLLFLRGIYKGKWYIQMKISLYMEYRYACQSSI